ncbi:MAG: mandelate racemase/muconate lactonizing enzyme family protein [Pseudomonadota bacterium]
MKIASVHLYRLCLPIAGKPYSFSTGSLSSIDTVLLKLTLDSGHVGWGETCPLGNTYAPAHEGGAVAALELILPHMIGCDAAPRPAHAQMDAVLMGHAYAKAAVDIALHDALGHAFGVPVSTLLGGSVASQVPAYYAIGIETPESAATIAKGKVVEGYTRLQLKCGGRPVQDDIATIRAVWDALQGTGVKLVVDANRSWTMRDAIQISSACRDIPLVIEQPCSEPSEHRQLKAHLSHPLFVDEDLQTCACVLDAIGTADGFGFKLTRAGGLAPATAFRDICAARNLPHTCDDGWGGDIIAAACLHLAATVRPDLLDAVWTSGNYIDAPTGYPNAICAKDGMFTVPDGPGLGVSVEGAALPAPHSVFA